MKKQINIIKMLSEDYNLTLAFKEFKKAAKQGNAFCQYQVALMYEIEKDGGNPLGTWQDYSKAFKYYNKAANQGLAIAQIKLGSMYFYGEYVSQKFEKAFEYFEKAASQENPHAQLMLGHMFEHGKGTIQNFEKAFEYYEKAASQDQIGALMHLGRMYENGIGTDIDLEKAFEYYKKAADNNYPGALIDLAEMYENGIGTNIDLEKYEEYIVKNFFLSECLLVENTPRIYKEESLKSADFIFEIGNERKKLIKNTFEELKKAVEAETFSNSICLRIIQTDAYSSDLDNIRHQLADMYFYGIGTEKNLKEAIKIYEKINLIDIDESSEIVQSIAVKRQLDYVSESSISLAKKSRYQLR